MNRQVRTTTLLTTVLLVYAIAVSGCAKKTHEVAMHDAAPHTGSHGGALVTLSDEAVRSAGITVGTSGAQPIDLTFELPGEIKVNAERSVDVRPPYPGRVAIFHAALGSRVSRGQPLAEILSNESLSGYVVSAPIGGTIIARPVSPGAAGDVGSLLSTV